MRLRGSNCFDSAIIISSDSDPSTADIIPLFFPSIYEAHDGIAAAADCVHDRSGATRDLYFRMEIQSG